jgi:hypothetical protein
VLDRKEYGTGHRERHLDPLFLPLVGDRRALEIPLNPVPWVEHERHGLKLVIETDAGEPLTVRVRVPAERVPRHAQERHGLRAERGHRVRRRPHEQGTGSHSVNGNAPASLVQRRHEKLRDVVGRERLLRDWFQDIGGSLIVPLNEGVDAIGRARLRAWERHRDDEHAGDEEHSLAHQRGSL